MQETLMRVYVNKCKEQENALHIKVDKIEEDLSYKYFIFEKGSWNLIKDYTTDAELIYVPKSKGSCMFMIQGKDDELNDSPKYTAIARYKCEDEKNVVFISSDKDVYEIGEKIIIECRANVIRPLYRFKIKANGETNALKDYSVDNQFVLTAKKSGTFEILVECKSADSLNEVECYETVNFEIKEIEAVEIVNFECMSKEMLVSEELVFDVSITKSNRTILYKFIKVLEDSKIKVLQDYSTNSQLRLVETVPGDNKILCLIKDMYSQRQYDDIAALNYSVKLYEPIIIKDFETDIVSPQHIGTDIQLKATIKGGKTLLYKYVIEGPEKEDRGYIQSDVYIWQPKKQGTYSVTLYVKDALFEGDFEASSSFMYEIKQIKREYASIKDVQITPNKPYVKNKPITINAISKGGLTTLYNFILYKNGEVYDEIEYSENSGLTWIPEESGMYSVDVRVKDKYSDKEYDSNKMLKFEVLDYLASKINFLLYDNKKRYMIDDTLKLNVVTVDSKETVYKYVIFIENNKIEESNYSEQNMYDFNLPRVGRYKIEVYCKNINSKEEFEDKQIISFNVYDAPQIINTTVNIENTDSIKANMPITITATNEGGKDLIYQFYILKENEWTLLQRYSKSNSHTFIVNKKGDYKILCMCKNTFKRCNYEDFSILEFTVEN